MLYFNYSALYFKNCAEVINYNFFVNKIPKQITFHFRVRLRIHTHDFICQTRAL